jgi:hypothetical protein
VVPSDGTYYKIVNIETGLVMGAQNYGDGIDHYDDYTNVLNPDDGRDGNLVIMHPIGDL